MSTQEEAEQEMQRREAEAQEQIRQHQALAESGHDAQFEALVEAIYLVASADGRFSGAECADLCARVSELSGGKFSSDEVETMRAGAEGRAHEGFDARAQAIAECLPDMEMRRSALHAASSAAYKGGGVGQKEGLALQKLARAFEIPINELHKIMSEAHG